MIKHYSHIEDETVTVDCTSNSSPTRATWYPESATLYVDTVKQLSPFKTGRDVITNVKTETAAEKIFNHYSWENMI